MARRFHCDTVELSRRHRRCDHALSRQRRRSDRACDIALGHRLPLRAAGGLSLASTLARTERCALGDAARLLLLRPVLRVLQHRDVLYDRGPRVSRAGDVAALDHGGRRAARLRDAQRAQDDWRLHRGVRSGGGARSRSFGRPRRRLARRSDHAGGRGLHGLLQRAVAAVHAALQRARLPHGRHGHRRGGTGDRGSLHRQSRGAERLWHGAMDRRRLSRRRRRRCRVHPLGAGAAAGDTDPRRQHHDRQSDRSGLTRNAVGRRADYAEPGRRPRRGLCRHLDRDLGRPRPA